MNILHILIRLKKDGTIKELKFGKGKARTRVDFWQPDEIEDSRLLFAVIAARYKGKWIFCRHKKRTTWEIPDCHREAGEHIDETAMRELREETGALQARIVPVCVYQVNREERCGMLFRAEITELGALSAGYEIVEVMFSDTLPEMLTYPGIQPKLFERILELSIDSKCIIKRKGSESNGSTLKR